MGFFDRIRAVSALKGHQDRKADVRIRDAEVRSPAMSMMSPSSLPLPPRQLLAAHARCSTIPQHLNSPPYNDLEDTPLRSLYRLYELIMLNYRFQLRNELEYFCTYHLWPVADIPDPHDPDPERYAVLSCIPDLLVRAFNRRTELGLHREMPAIMCQEEIEEFRTRAKVFESVPAWTERVPALQRTLRIPHEDNKVIEDSRDERASPAFKRRNILLWHPHIHFV